MSKYDGELAELLLKKAADEYISSQSRAVDESLGSLPEHKFSADFEKNMQRSLRRAKARERLSALPKLAAAAAAALLVFCIAMPDTAIAYKNKFINIFRRETPEFIETRYTASNVEYPLDDFPADRAAIYAPSMLPSGYSVKKVEGSSAFYAVTFERNGTQLRFECITSNEHTRYVDNKTHNTKTVRLKSGKGMYTYGEKDCMLHWSVEDCDYSLLGYDLTEKEYIDIADSLVRIK